MPATAKLSKTEDSTTRFTVTGDVDAQVLRREVLAALGHEGRAGSSANVQDGALIVRLEGDLPVDAAVVERVVAEHKAADDLSTIRSFVAKAQPTQPEVIAAIQAMARVVLAKST